MTRREAGPKLRRMRRAGHIVACVLAEMRPLVGPGITTRELDEVAESLIREMGGVPSFKGYLGYPASLCTSVNEEVVHGIPGPRRLVEGDIISIDVGVVWRGYQGDGAITLGVGEVTPGAQRLMEATRAALEAGIAAARTGVRLGEVSHSIEMAARSAGYQVIRKYGGHGIGKRMHEAPHIPNWGLTSRGPTLVAGMTLALEPMLSAGGYSTRQLADGWTVVTRDESLTAHYEDTIVVAENGGEVLTRILESVK